MRKQLAHTIERRFFIFRRVGVPLVEQSEKPPVNLCQFFIQTVERFRKRYTKKSDATEQEAPQS